MRFALSLALCVVVLPLALAADEKPIPAAVTDADSGLTFTVDPAKPNSITATKDGKAIWNINTGADSRVVKMQVATFEAKVLRTLVLSGDKASEIRFDLGTGKKIFSEDK